VFPPSWTSHLENADGDRRRMSSVRTTEDRRVVGADEAQFIAVARAGDAAGFAFLTERYRRELHGTATGCSPPTTTRRT
jgi:hypothetical protein